MDDNENQLNEPLPSDFPEPSGDDKAVEKSVRKDYVSESHSDRPRTISELKEFCSSKNMPLEKMRFFIGMDYREPKAFGIYQTGDEFVVYKNKANGSRAIRYQGKDEAFAVGELYDKLLDECHMRGYYPENGFYPGSLSSSSSSSYLSSYKGSRRSSSKNIQDVILENPKQGCISVFLIGSIYRWVLYLIRLIFTILIFVFFDLLNIWVVIAAGAAFFLVWKFITEEKFTEQKRKAMLIGIPVIILIAGQFLRLIGTGYYQDGNNRYYRDRETWYQYISGSWQKISAPPDFSERKEYLGRSADFPANVASIYDSVWWNTRYFMDFAVPEFPSDPGFIDDLFDSFGNSSDSSSDSDWDWDWDSSDTDWDSDW